MLARSVSYRDFTLPGAFSGLIGFATLEPSQSSRRSLIPKPAKKIEIETRDHSENASECPLDPDFHPVVVKITKNDFLGDFGPKKVPKWALRAAGWDPQSPSKIDWVKYFLIQLSISSKKPPTPGWLGVPKMYLTQKFLISKAFYPAAVRAARGEGCIWALSHFCP